MAKKRERLEIIKDILQTVQSSRKIKPTRLLYASNLSPQMFKDYISELQEKGFIEDFEEKKKKYFVLTTKGQEYLMKYRELSSFITNFGL